MKKYNKNDIVHDDMFDEINLLKLKQMKYISILDNSIFSNKSKEYYIVNDGFVSVINYE